MSYYNVTVFTNKVTFQLLLPKNIMFVLRS